MEHYNDQVAGSLKNKKMLIFTDVTESIMTDDKKNLLKSAEIEEILKKGNTYILYKDDDELTKLNDIISNPKATKSYDTFKKSFLPIFNGLSDESTIGDTYREYFDTIFLLFELSGADRIIGIEVNKLSANDHKFNLSLTAIKIKTDNYYAGKINKRINRIEEWKKDIELNSYNQGKINEINNTIDRIRGTIANFHRLRNRINTLISKVTEIKENRMEKTIVN